MIKGSARSYQGFKALTKSVAAANGIVNLSSLTFSDVVVCEASTLLASRRGGANQQASIYATIVLESAHNLLVIHCPSRLVIKASSCKS